MRTVELCGRPSPRPLPGLRSASGSPRACLWFTRYHNRLRAAQSSVRLYRVLKSHQSLVRKSRARHGIVLPHGGWRMPAPASRRARGRLTSANPCRFSFHRTRTHSQALLFTSKRLRLRWLRSEVQVSTFYSSTRVSQRPPVSVHVHVIAELLARACHVTCARTPRFRPPRPAVRVFRTFRDSVASGSVPPSRPRKLAPLLVIRAHLSEQ